MFDVYLDYIFAFSLNMTDHRNDTQHGYNLIGYVLQLLMQMRHTDNRHIIANADVYLSAMSVSKAAYSFEVLVFPYPLIFSIMVLVGHISNGVVSK